MRIPPVVASLLLLGTGAAGAASSTLLPREVTLENVVTAGLSAPLALRHAPADPRLFVVEQGGAIRIIDAGGSLLPAPFLRIAGAGGTAPPLGFSNGGERGLLGLAFHPQYAANGRFFISYTDGAGDTVIAQYLRSAGDPNLANPASGSVVLRADQDFSNHNGGDIHFGPDGFLYIGLGDGGDGNDPCNRAQTLQIANILSGAQNGQDCTVDGGFTGNGGDPTSLALMGKMLRIDVDATAAADQELCGAGGNGTAPYGVPPDNPYAAADGICNEVWHAGLRNPFRFSFDRDNGDLLIGDVGQGAREEVDVVPGDVGGLNFGWRCREGDIAGARTSLCGSPPPFTPPVLVYDHSGGNCSITGGFRYRGPLAALDGVYFYADYCSGRHYVGRSAAGVWSSQQWLDVASNPASFGEGADGTLYVVNLGGSVQRIATPALFRDGAEPEQ